MFSPGQKYRPSAARENEIDRLLRDARARSGAFAPLAGDGLPLGHVRAKNTSGATIGFGGCALYTKTGYSNTEETPRRDWDPRKGFFTLVALQNILSNPTTAIGGMAVALEPIANNDFGLVAIAGLAVCSVTATDVGYIRPNGATAIRDHWGFARILSYDTTGTGFSVVNLSDTRFQVFYTLTANMSAGSASATLCPNGSSWTTTVHDPEGIAGWQTIGDSGFVEWRGNRWSIVIPLCD